MNFRRKQRRYFNKTRLVKRSSSPNLFYGIPTIKKQNVDNRIIKMRTKNGR